MKPKRATRRRKGIGKARTRTPMPTRVDTPLVLGIHALHRSVQERSNTSPNPHTLRAFAASLSQLENEYRRAAQIVSAEIATHPTRPPAGRSGTSRSRARTSQTVLRALIESAALASGDVVYVVGCEDGGLAIALAKRRGLAVVGMDTDEHALEIARARGRESRVGKRVRFVRGDVMDVSLRRATVVILQRVSVGAQTLTRQLLDRLRPGTRIVSHTVDLGHWVTRESRSIDGRRVRCWTVPSRGG